MKRYLIVSCVLVAASCGGKKEANKDPSEVAGKSGKPRPSAPDKARDGGAASPEQVAELLWLAVRDGDVAGELALIHDGDIALVAALDLMAIAADVAMKSADADAKRARLKRVLDSHGVSESIVPTHGKVDLQTVRALERELHGASRALSRDLRTITMEDGEVDPTEPHEVERVEKRGASLAEVYFVGGGEPLHVIRVDGRWYVDIAKDIENRFAVREPE